MLRGMSRGRLALPSRVLQERCGTQRENATEAGVERSGQAKTGRFLGEARLACEPSASGALWDSEGECHRRRCGAKRQARPGDFSARPACVPSRVLQERCGTQRENAIEGGVERSDRQRPGDFSARPTCVPSRVLQERCGECHGKRCGAKRQAKTGRFLGEAGLRAEPSASGALWGMPCKAVWSEATV
jgi:hypothetical protein